MTRCKHCRQPIHGEFVRFDAGARIGTALAFDIVEHDIDLHEPCYGPWMLENYPWCVQTREHPVE